MPAEQYRRADEHHQRGKKRDEDRVVEQVERPHAARHLAHRRAGEAVGMPVGREALDTVEGIRRDVGHHLQREIDDLHEGDVTAGNRAGGERNQHQERRHRGIPGSGIGRRAARHRVDQAARIERRQDVGKRRDEHGNRDDGKTPRLPAPVAEREGENAAESSAVQIQAKASHDSHKRPCGRFPRKIKQRVVATRLRAVRKSDRDAVCAWPVWRGGQADAVRFRRPCPGRPYRIPAFRPPSPGSRRHGS